ncbi:unnamed protein product [Prunus armeniaca]|uniref:Acetyltransferase n=1 Tax=Prunus armeniaca TaxID=36596 RepID=A0A6J5VEB4_PRUAR|nr:unnamed protein product [Prunus armeniaca]CAB4317766.1 unnamed protein product [Prunus armeniaca]
MGYIRFISTTIVQPTFHNELTQRIELTPWDLQLILLDHIQKGLLFHKPKSSTYEQDPITSLTEHLKHSLSLTLDIFYPLAGRLAITENEDDNTTSFSVDCNGAGAEFVHAVADGVTVADILDSVLVPDDIVHSFFLMNGVLNYEGSGSKPLLAVQITELVDGIFIGCTMNHSVVDGSSFWHFFNTWSEISRRGSTNCGKILQPPPAFGREFLNGMIDLPVRLPNFQNKIPKIRFSAPLLQQRVFHFSKQKIAKLKAKANAEMGTTRISSLQALLAHLWVSVTRNQRLETDQETQYKVLVGMRQRLQPPLPDQYLGNAVLFGIVTSTVGELLERGLGWAAWEMNKTISSQTEQDVRKLLEGWIKDPKVPKLDGLASNSLLTGSSPRFNVFGNDFGWGRPLAVRSGVGNKFDGKLTVYPGAEDGSIDFEACLLPQTLQALAHDAEFTASLAA